MSDKPAARNNARSPDTEAAAEHQRELQRQQDRKDQAKAQAKVSAKEGGTSDNSGAVQAGHRPQPEDLPAQHLTKPGLEAEMDLQPRFYAPDYRGSGKLKGMVALITGGDSDMGRAVAVLYA